MPLELEKRAQAYAVREQARLVVKYLSSDSATYEYEDNLILIAAAPFSGSDATISLKVPSNVSLGVSSSSATSASSVSSGSASFTLAPVFSMSGDNVNVFRHSARWVDYLNDLATEASDLETAALAASSSVFDTIDDDILFPDNMDRLSPRVQPGAPAPAAPVGQPARVVPAAPAAPVAPVASVVAPAPVAPIAPIAQAAPLPSKTA